MYFLTTAISFFSNKKKYKEYSMVMNLKNHFYIFLYFINCSTNEQETYISDFLFTADLVKGKSRRTL